MQKSKNIIIKIISIIILISLLFIGITIMNDRKYILVGIIISVIGCGMMYYKYMTMDGGIRRSVIIAVLITIAVVGRCIFAPFPGFKPVTAIVIIAATYIGSEGGFVIGSLTAFMSDMFFGLGPWTPFQMVAWGMIGFVAGIYWIRAHKNNKMLMIVEAIIAGIWYSAFMDIWSVMSVSGKFEIKKYFAYLITSLPYMFIYIISNVIFVIALHKPLGEKLDRINKKHNIF